MVWRDEARETIESALKAQVSRRNVLKKGMILGASAPVLASLLAACADDDDDDDAVVDEPVVDDPVGEEPDADDDDEPVDADDADDDDVDEPEVDADERYGGSLIIAQPNDFVNMWPAFTTGPTIMHCYDALLRWDYDGEIWDSVPMLAESWEVEEDGATFHLREDVTFHDGTQFDAEAVAWNIEQMATHPQSQARPNLPTVNEDNPAEAIDEFTVRINLDAPDGPLLIELSDYHRACMMASPTAFENIDRDEEGDSIIIREAVGTGPFIFEEWVTGSYVSARRNPDYWATDDDGNQLPYLDEVRVNWVSDDSVRLLEMRSGAADLTNFIRGRDISAVENDPDLQYVEDPASSGTIHRFFFNALEGPFADDPDLRKAVQFAIDREAMAETVGGGLGIPGTLDVAPGTPGYDPDRVPYYYYDPEQAQFHREQSDAPSGLEFRLVVIAREVDEQQAQMLQQFLREIDLEVIIELVERAAWGDQVRRGNDFDMATQRGGMAPDQAGGWTLRWSPDDPAAYARPQDPELWEFLQSAREVTDPEERHEAYIELQEMMFEAAWWGVYWIQPDNLLLSARTHGLSTIWTGNVDYRPETLWVDND